MTKLARRFLAIGAVCTAVGLIGCGTDPESPAEIAKSTGGLDTFLPCPGASNVGLPFDTGTTQCTSSGDWDHTGIISPRAFYTSDNGHYYAAECGADSTTSYHYVVGVSAQTSAAQAHSAKCDTTSHGVRFPSSRHYLSRTNSQGGHIDDIGFFTYDWDPGHTKAECGFHEVVTGIAQLASKEIDAISCGPGSVTTSVSPQTCNVLTFDFQGDHCLRNCSGFSDWAQGFYKNTCQFGQYVRGVSKVTRPGSIGEIHAILCCNWN